MSDQKVTPFNKGDLILITNSSFGIIEFQDLGLFVSEENGRLKVALVSDNRIWKNYNRFTEDSIWFQNSKGEIVFECFDIRLTRINST